MHFLTFFVLGAVGVVLMLLLSISGLLRYFKS